MLKMDSTPIISPEIIGRNYDQETVLVDTHNAQVKVINEVGAFIWSLIDGVRSVRDIALLVSQEYEVTQADAEQDTLEFVNELSQRGLIDALR